MHYRARHTVDFALAALAYCLPALFAVVGFGASPWLAFSVAILGAVLSLIWLGMLRGDDDADDYGFTRDYLYVLPIYALFLALLFGLSY